jgi:heat shock protein beta-11
MAEIIFSTSYDDRHPPQNVLNNDSDFWISSGLYPQELVIQLQVEKAINSITIESFATKKISVETCENDSAVNFVKQAEKEVDNRDGFQETNLSLSSGKTVKIIKVIILDGHDNFCSIRNITFK